MNLLTLYQTKYKEDVIVSYKEKTGLYTIKYKHSGVDFSDYNLRIARGLTLTGKGEIVLAGFEKFFNYKQLENDTRYSTSFIQEFSDLGNYDLDKKLLVSEKLDGTMFVLGVYNDEVVISTTSSTDNNFTEIALSYFNQLENIDEIKSYLKDYNLTLIFEWTSPYNYIGVQYEEDKYTLIGANIIKGDEITPLQKEGLLKISQDLDLEVVEFSYLSLDELLTMQKEATNFEGFVAYNKYGRLIKFKTKDWFSHKEYRDLFFGFKPTKRKTSTLYDSLKSDTVDDLLALKNQSSDNISWVDTYVQNYYDLLSDLEDFYSKASEMEWKEVFLTYRDEPLHLAYFSSKSKGQQERIDKILKDFLYKKIKEL